MIPKTRLRWLASMVVAASFAGSAPAADIVVDRKAGDLINDIATATRKFRLATVPSDLRVRSQKMRFSYELGELAYSGSVQVAQGNIRLQADELQIQFEPQQTGALRVIRAMGNVQIQHRNESALGDLAVYDPAAATLTLTGNVRLGSGPNSLQGERVIVYIDEDRTEIQGSPLPSAPDTATPEQATAPGTEPKPTGRVRAVIDPKSLELDKVLE
jgi:lipopolysaccharide export system protein LptA